MASHTAQPTRELAQNLETLVFERPTLEIRVPVTLPSVYACRRPGRDLEGPVEIKTPPHEETKHSA